MSSTEFATQAPFELRSHNPDVLTCIANLSNDEVFTPPQLANQMLDSLEVAWSEANNGASIWSDPTVTFLDPFAKSGVFLREIVSRLNAGLKSQIPDLNERVDHILAKQVYGIGITRLTSLLARRSVYCSKDATGEHSIATSFDRDWGNIWFERTEHTWAGDKCAYCGAARSEYARSDQLETHAYAFIHTRDVKKRIQEIFGVGMQFDVVIGNPPYQLDDGGHNNSAAPIYQHFVDAAIALDPRFVVMVTPSRWFTGGRGLDKYRERMLASRRLRHLVDYPKLYDAFPGVKIRGGISYFLRDRDYDGACVIQTMWDGEPLGEPVARYLDEFDVLVRRNEAISILKKVRAREEPTLESVISAGKPFGLRTFFHGQASQKGLNDPVKLYGSQKITWVERSVIHQNSAWIDDWKVLMTAVQGTSAAVETKFLSKPIVAPPGSACTETYLVAAAFATENQARMFASFLRSRFVRFLVSLRKATQHANRDVYSFVPVLDFEVEWSDAALYDRYELSGEEIAFVESQIAAHDDKTGVANSHG
ncbi:Eco57I restriction-modification methylase domain-containing protein [Agreia sp.]|uniref:Eco57I restriction-modification methylase domain-containing protein n=1 Tax=Agreia sp. TaxID=1872416 RepID=UPI0035BC0295